MPLPSDFDAETYLELNRDIRAAGVDAAEHYLTLGIKEGRRYKEDMVPPPREQLPLRETEDIPPHWKVCDFPDGGDA